MARKRSRIRDIVKWLIYRRAHGYKIVYVDRSRDGQVFFKEAPLDRITSVDSWAIHLDAGETTIPFHRIVEIRDEAGFPVWSRWQKKE